MRGKFRSYKLRDRQQRKKRRTPRKPLPYLWHKRDPSDPLQIILKNGTRIRCLEGEDVYVSLGGRVYTLTMRGLHEIRVDFCRNKNYCKPTKNGRHHGRRYPYVMFRGKKFTIHIYMCKVWLGAKPEGYETDHINGDIDDFRLLNLRYVTPEENVWCGRILKRLRKAARELHDPSLDPINIPQPRLLKIFETLTVGDPHKIMDDDFTHYREF